MSTRPKTATEHTPGDWKVRPYGNLIGVYEIDTIVDDRTSGKPIGNDAADIALIEAASDLLKALIYLQPLAIKTAPLGIDPKYWDSAFAKVEAAISKVIL